MSNKQVPTLLRHVIHCHWSGLAIGTLEVQIAAGALPYLSHWNKSIAYHPLFSLQPGKLLAFMRDEWDRLHQAVADEEISDAESNMLRVGFLAMLHSLDCIKQDVAALPSLHIVQNNIGSLFAISYWKWKLESERFRFPTLHISKFNKNDNFENIKDYLDVCFDVRKAYETNVQEATEKAKVLAAEKAMIMLSNTWLAPVSKRVLWRWVRTNLPQKFQADADGWLGTIFLGGNHVIWDFEEADVLMAEEIIVSECPAGTGIMFAVRERLKDIKQIWGQKHAAYEIELEDFAPTAKLFVNGKPVAAPHPGDEPKEADFPKRTTYLIKHAQWRIANAAYSKQQKEGNQE